MQDYLTAAAASLISFWRSNWKAVPPTRDKILCFTFKLHACCIGFRSEWDHPPGKKKKKKIEWVCQIFRQIWQTTTLASTCRNPRNLRGTQCFFLPPSLIQCCDTWSASIDYSAKFVLDWCNSLKSDFWGEFTDLHGNTVSFHFPASNFTCCFNILYSCCRDLNIDLNIDMIFYYRRNHIRLQYHMLNILPLYV